MADADKMLEWKNYPETRQFSILTHDEVSKDEHYYFLEENLSQFQVLEVNIVTFMEGDKSAPLMAGFRIKNGEVSIWVDEGYRKRGIATYLLQNYTVKDTIAKIVDGNVASMKAFVKAGYKPIDYKDNYYILQK